MQQRATFQQPWFLEVFFSIKNVHVKGVAAINKINQVNQNITLPLGKKKQGKSDKNI